MTCGQVIPAMNSLALSIRALSSSIFILNSYTHTSVSIRQQGMIPSMLDALDGQPATEFIVNVGTDLRLVPSKIHIYILFK